jgi:arsenate reductase
MKLAFVCVQNAGRSQMAAAFAERERRERGLDWTVLTGGTDPADHVHPVVVEAMREVDIDPTGRVPRAVTPDELEDADYVLTMGCSAEGICPVTFVGDARDWDLDDPHDRSVEAVRSIRDDIGGRVRALFDELESA